MLEHEINLLLASILSATVSLPQRPAPIGAKSPALMGLDTEWDPQTEGNPLLSVQLALAIGDKWIVRVFDPPGPRIDPLDLLHLARQVLEDAGVELKPDRRRVRRLRFVGHFMQAELSMFSDALGDLAIQRINKGHHVVSHAIEDDDGTKWLISLFDLYAIYQRGLDKVGKLIDLPKLDADRTNLAELKRTDRARYDLYAGRDAQIPVAAYLQLRQALHREFDVDIWQCLSLASIGATLFKYRFLSSPPCPTKVIPTPVNRRTKGGWRRAERRVLVFDGDRDVRLAACRAYWGGRAEAFVQGLILGAYVELDAVSLYPHAALLQPLPTERTRWYRVSRLKDVLALEGFGRFKFRFPRGFEHPSLPVKIVSSGVLCFPLQGQADCTFAEIRAALELGAEVTVVEGWGFTPGPTERDHDVGRFMREFLARKARATKGTLEYETAKLIVNSLVGKLGEIRRGDHLLSVEHEFRRLGASGVTQRIASSSHLRAALKEEPEAGRLYAPEWAALILGRSRALMAPLVSAGAILVSTDSVVLPRDVADRLVAPDTTCNALVALRSVGSDLLPEGDADAVFVARARQYVFLKRPDNVTDQDRVFHQDDKWAVVRVARHGTRESKEEFAETVLQCLKAGKEVAQPREKTRIVAAPEAVRRGLEINQEVVEARKTHFRWDNKRRLLNRDVNIFTSMSATVPYQTTRRAQGADRQREVRAGARRRAPIRRSNAVVRQVLDMIAEGKGAREIARETGVPRSTVQDMIRRLRHASDGRQI